MSGKVISLDKKYESNMSKIYYQFLNENMKTDENLVHVECDLGLSLLKIDSYVIKDRYPFQYINVGIQESNAVGVAAGLSNIGFKPFVHSFGTFMSRRVADQAFISGAYSKANFAMIGSDPGVLAAYNGGTHMPLEDVAIMRAIPEMTIVEPSDPVSARAIFNEIYKTEGMHYIRLGRKESLQIYDEDETFELGKGKVLIDGTDVTIIASGILVKEAIEAAYALNKENISARVVDMFTIKPVDCDLINQCASETGAIVTAENHNVINGLSSAISEVVMENYVVPIERVGVYDTFGQVGDVQYLKKYYKLTADEIIKKAKRLFLGKQVY